MIARYQADIQTVKDSYTHNLNKLLVTAGLKQQLHTDGQTNPQLQSNWMLVTNWSEQFRYQHSITQATAQDFHRAVTDNQAGILPWLKNFM